MFTDAGVLDRLLGICHFVKCNLFESVDMECQGQVELALELDQQQLFGLYDELCEQDWVDGSIAQALTTSCELGLAACLVLKSALWDVAALSSFREAEGALQEARSYYVEALSAMRSASQDVQLFA